MSCLTTSTFIYPPPPPPAFKKKRNVAFNMIVKVKFVHAMWAYRVSKGTGLLILNLSARWRWVVTSCSGRVTPRKLLYPLNARLGGPQSWSGCFVEEKNVLPLPRFEPRDFRPVAYSRYGLRYRGLLVLTEGCQFITLEAAKFHHKYFHQNAFM
jgi:hypothetical protein